MPEYVRAKEEITFLLTNFAPIKQIGKFVILRKEEKSVDIFSSQYQKLYPDLVLPLLNINLGMIPKSEGEYKSPDGIPDGEGNFLLVHSSPGSESLTSLVITINNGMKTNVSFASCQGKTPCVIDLASLPLLYTKRKIINISHLGLGEVTTQIIHIPNSGKFW